jgi:CRISPR-associated protein Cas1
MSRPLCDPIDLPRVLSELATSATTPLKAYREYASEAARPYARSSFDAILDRAQNGSAKPNDKRVAPQIDDAFCDMASDAYWARFLPVKPRVLTTVHDNASLRVKGGALIVCDGDHKIVYEAGAVKPHAIVMTGWSGVVTVEAMRFACDHKIAILLLDWTREFLSIVGTPAKQSVGLIRSQVLADPVGLARIIVAHKLAAYVRANAMGAERAAKYVDMLPQSCTVQEIMNIEAHAARAAWDDTSIPLIVWRGGSPRVPNLWKLPYSSRRRLKSFDQRSGGNARRAVHPVNGLLNVAFSVTAGRLAAHLSACGAHPAIGFLHSDKPGRWSLAYDAIEPLRPLIESRVFDFIRNHQFGSNDFVLARDGQIRLMDNLLRVVIAETAVSGRILDAAVNWMIDLIREPQSPVSLTQSFDIEPGLLTSPIPVSAPLTEELCKHGNSRVG